VDNSKDIVIVADWKVDAPEDWTVEKKDDKRYIYVEETKNQDLHHKLNDLLVTQYNNINILEDHTELSGLSVRPTPDYVGHDDELKPEWCDDLDTDMYSIMMCSHYHKPTENDSEIINSLKSNIQEIAGENITNDKIQNIKLYYSDFHYNRLDGIRYNILSENPHLYYDNVQSLDEYLSKKKEVEDDMQELDDKTVYEVLIPFNREDAEMERPTIPKNITSISESYMNQKMESIISYPEDGILEGESVIFDGESIETNFWVRQNI
jgi:hypothetical protein